jgi:hypothetical protein
MMLHEAAATWRLVPVMSPLCYRVATDAATEVA